MLPDLASLYELVRDCAREELLPRFAGVQRHVKHDGSLLTEADLALQRRLERELAVRWPQYEFLGEEMTGHEHVALTAGSAKALWCLDPLDGTSNFAAGIPFFAVSLALLIGGRPEIGIVYDPVRDECFAARRGQGAWLDGENLARPVFVPEALRWAIAAVDFKRLEPALAARLGGEPPYGSQRNFGSSSLEWCWLADGRFHVYLHGGQKLWDYAAGSLILAEAGGVSATLEGEEVFAFSLDPRSVVAARAPALFREWQTWLRRQRAG